MTSVNSVFQVETKAAKISKRLIDPRREDIRVRVFLGGWEEREGADARGGRLADEVRDLLGELVGASDHHAV